MKAKLQCPTTAKFKNNSIIYETNKQSIQKTLLQFQLGTEHFPNNILLIITMKLEDKKEKANEESASFPYIVTKLPEVSMRK